jgi:hypothetical protein
MYSLVLDRPELLELTRRPGDAFAMARQSRSSHLKSFAKEEVMALWPDSDAPPRELPRVIVVNDEVEDDFLAWISAYGQWLRPLTAYCRVVSTRDAEFQLDGETRDSWHEQKSFELANASAGLLLCEAYSYLNVNDNISQLPAIAVERTFSFVMARAAYLANGSKDSVSDLFAKWRRMRVYSGFDMPEEAAEALIGAWDALLSTFWGESLVDHPKSRYSVDPQIIDFCRTIAERGEPSFHAWKALTEPFPGLDHALDEMRGTREHRVTTLQRAQRVLVDAPSSLRAPVVFGYLASLMAPGTLEHIDVVRNMSLRQSAPLYWYGVFAGLPRESKVLLEGAGLARRIMRDVVRPHSIFDRPTCDVALKEFEVMSRLGDIESVIPVLRPGYLEIELQAGVNTVVRTRKAARRKASDLFPESSADDQVAFAVPKLERALSELYSIYERLKPQPDEPASAKRSSEPKPFRRQRK